MDTTIKYNRIKAELSEAGVTNKTLAAFLGIHETTVSDWCTNTNQPSIQTLYLIAAHLNIDVRKLLVPNKLRSEAEPIIREERTLDIMAENRQAYDKRKKAAKSAPARPAKKKR